MTTAIGFSTNNSFISRVIRWFTGAKYSHSFIVFDDPVMGGKFILEADWDGFHIKSFTTGISNTTKVELIPLGDNADELVPKLTKYLGAPYDYSGLLGMSLVMIGRRIKHKWKNPTQDTRSMFCSEAIVIGLQLIKYPEAEQLVASSTSPHDLYNFLKK